MDNKKELDCAEILGLYPDLVAELTTRLHTDKPQPAEYVAAFAAIKADRPELSDLVDLFQDSLGLKDPEK